MPNDRLEQFIAEVSPVGEAVEIPLELLTPPPVFVSSRSKPTAEFDQDGFDQDENQLVELIALPTFAEQWGMIHDIIGGLVTQRTGNPCAIGDQARAEGGRVACEAAYNLCASSPALSRMFLSPSSSYFGQIAAIGLHGFACVQIVKASTNHPPKYEENGVG